MIPYLKSFRESLQKNKILVENFTFLSALQIANLLLFLITIPYLFKVLGTLNYGLVIFVQTVVYYFSVFVNFGFNLTATRDISVNRDNPEKVSEIVSSVLIIKLFFFFISLIVMLLLTSLIANFREFRLLYILSMIACLSEAVFPVWYFQGIEKMKYITFINITTRVISTVLVFILIRFENDYFKYPVIAGIGTFSGAIFALRVIFGNHGIRFRLYPVKILKTYLSDNILYFLSNVSTQIYVNANKLITGAFLGMTAVAYYDVAEKVINIVKVPYSVLTQALFPRFAKMRNILFLNKILIITFSVTILITLLILIFSKFIISFISSPGNTVSIDILRILSLSLIPISISIFYGDIYMISSDMKTRYAKMRFLGLVIYLILFLIIALTGFMSVYLIAAIILAVEIFIAAYSYLIFRSRDFT